MPLIVLVWVVCRWLQIVAAQTGASGGFFNGLLEAARTDQVDLAFVTLAQVLHQGRVALGSMWVVPTAMYPKLNYEGVLLKSGTQKDAAKALVQLLLSHEGQMRINRFGFGP